MFEFLKNNNDSKKEDIQYTFKESKAETRDSYSSYSEGRKETNRVDKTLSYEQYHNLINDSNVRPPFIKLRNLILARGYRILKTNKLSTNESAKTSLKEMGFDDYLRQFILTTLFHKNSATEVVVNEDELNEVHNLDVTTISIEVTDYGETKGYVQKIGGEVVAEWDPEEIVYSRLDPFDSSVVGNIDLPELNRLVKYKQVIEDFMYFILSSNKYAEYWKTTNEEPIPKEKKKQIMQDWKSHKEDPDSEFLVSGVERVIFKEFDFIDNLINLLQYYKEEIYGHIGIYPGAWGDSDQGGRSEEDVQLNSNLYEDIVSYQSFFENEINNKLFPKLGFNAEIRFNRPLRIPQKTIIENALKLKSLGLSEDNIKRYLLTRELPTDIVFEQKEEDQVIRNQRSNQTAQSREEKDPNMTQKSTGEESTTREEQLQDAV